MMAGMLDKLAFFCQADPSSPALPGRDLSGKEVAMADQKAKEIGVCDRCGESVTDTDGFAHAEAICVHHACQSIESSFALLDFMELALRLETETARVPYLNEVYWHNVPSPSTPENYCLLIPRLIDLAGQLGHARMKLTLQAIQQAFRDLCTKRN